MLKKYKTIEFVSIYLVVSVLYGLFALLLVFPFHPITVAGWTVWFAAALPISMAGEAIGSGIFDKRIGESINPDTNHVSAWRIGYGVAVTLILVTLLLTVVWLLDQAWGDFWDANFSSNW